MEDFRKKLEEVKNLRKALRGKLEEVASILNACFARVGIEAQARVVGLNILLEGEDDPKGKRLWGFLYPEVGKILEKETIFVGGNCKIPPDLGEILRELLFTPCSPSAIISTGETQERR